MEEVEKDHQDEVSHTAQSSVNFVKCRQFARIIQQVHKYQGTAYNLHRVEVSFHEVWYSIYHNELL